MNEKDAIEIIIRAFEDARGSILFRDEIQAVNYLEDYVKNSVSKDKIREKLKYYQEMGKDIQGHWYYENEIEVLEELLEESE